MIRATSSAFSLSFSVYFFRRVPEYIGFVLPRWSVAGMRTRISSPAFKYALTQLYIVDQDGGSASSILKATSLISGSRDSFVSFETELVSIRSEERRVGKECRSRW